MLSQRWHVHFEWRVWGCSGFVHWHDWRGVMPPCWTLHIGPLIIIRLGLEK